MTTVVSTCAHLLVTLLPVIAALWGMTLLACSYEWAVYRRLVQGARYTGRATTWIVVEWRGEDQVHGIRCTQLVLRRYERGS